jgi:putative Mg2+ transporter-C (MgtC) family protein
MQHMNDMLLGISVFSPVTIALRLFCSVVAGFIIGFERSQHNQPAGLRTHMVIALGASSIMIVSMLLPLQFATVTHSGDPGRMAAQVISGIGFLGAGAIFRYGFNVKGLTTAASIWTMSGIGLVFGAGFYMLGAMATILLYLILHVMDRVENWLVSREKLRLLKIVFSSKTMPVKSVMRSVAGFVDVKQTSLIENVEKDEVELEVYCKIAEHQSIRKLFEKIKGLGAVKSLKIE